MKKVQRIIGCIGFILVFLVLFTMVTKVLIKKTTAQPQSIYTEPDNSLDVVFVGSSHVYAAVFPVKLYEEYGIASCNVATSAQTLGTSYCAVKEAIEEQQPEVIVLEMYSMYNGSSYGSYADFHWFMDSVPFGVRKYNLLKEMLPGKEWSRYLFPIVEYHNRWKELEEKDFYPTQEEAFNKGATCSLFGVTETFEDLEILPKESMTGLPEGSLEYLSKIVELCRKREVELLLITIPFYADGSAVHQDQGIYNAVAPVAKEWDVPYINLFHHLEELDFDFSTDMGEWSHVNEKGADKVTEYLGRYLTENYELPDRRGEKAYSYWEEDVERYQNLRREKLSDIIN